MNTINAILDFAISNEINAQKFYLKLVEKSRSKHMKKVFKEFAAEEVQHRLTLERVRNGEKVLEFSDEIENLKIAEHLAEVDLDKEGDLDLQQALVLAMKAEKEAYNLYIKLAELAEEPEIKAVFNGLAREEANHKLRFETEYDDSILREN
jgi:rubrerythrin